MIVLTSLYIFISLFLFLYWYKENKQDSIFKLSVILFLPIVGYILLAVLYMRKIFIQNINKTSLVDGFANECEANELPALTDLSEATKLIPVEEALLLNNSKIKKSTLLELLKNGKHSDLLRIALSDEDTETSHYAAVGIVEAKRKLQKSFQKSKAEYEIDKNNNTTIQYARALKNYLDNGFLDKSTKEGLGNNYQDLLKVLLEFYEFEEDFFVDLINIEIGLGQFKNAAIYCNKYYNAHPHSDKTYLMYLKLYYFMGDKNNFNHIINTLKESYTAPCNDIWNIVKFWAEG
ncbi:MAG: hypothetical protein GX154_06770 [Clostridiales bacterium]|nr:hypothetical protein [Clostridiales bacterium]